MMTDRRFVWHNATQSYRGTTSDGKVVDVTGDEWSESMRDGIQAYIDNQSHVDIGTKYEGNLDDFARDYSSLYEKYENLTWTELNDADMWAPLVGDNPNVEFVEA